MKNKPFNYTKAEYNALLHNDLESFSAKAFAEIHGSKKLQMNWHIKAIIYHLNLALSGKQRKLIINIPPRFLKSFIVTIAFTAWVLGRDPSKQIICASYAQKLVEDHALLCRTIMESDWFREAFTEWAPNEHKYATDFQKTSMNGFRRSVSVGGVLTGLGGEILIIDDPHNADEAHSDTKRQNAINWLDTVAMSRLNNPEEAIIIVIQQRIHEDDISGHLLEKGGWTHLCLPLVAQEDMEIPIGDNKLHLFKEGELLHPQWRSEADVKAIRSDTSSPVFATQYLQAPAPLEGNMVKAAWFKNFSLSSQLPDFKRKPGDVVVQSWDTALSTSDTADYSVCLTFLYRNGISHLLDVQRHKLSPLELYELMVKHYQQWKSDLMLVEMCVGSMTTLEILQRNKAITLIPDQPKGSKIQRLMEVLVIIEAGKIKLHPDAHWRPQFLKEVLEFPNSKRDDIVDALSMYLKWVRVRCYANPNDPGFEGGAAGKPAEYRVHFVDKPMPDLSINDIFTKTLKF